MKITSNFVALSASWMQNAKKTLEWWQVSALPELSQICGLKTSKNRVSLVASEGNHCMQKPHYIEAHVWLNNSPWFRVPWVRSSVSLNKKFACKVESLCRVNFSHLNKKILNEVRFRECLKESSGWNCRNLSNYETIDETCISFAKIAICTC